MDVIVSVVIDIDSVAKRISLKVQEGKEICCECDYLGIPYDVTIQVLEFSKDDVICDIDQRLPNIVDLSSGPVFYSKNHVVRKWVIWRWRSSLDHR